MMDGDMDASKTRGIFQGHRVLVVDDLLLNRIVLKGLLSLYDIRPDLACDGAEALQACSRNTYDLVLTDSHMPVMDGFECARRLRRDHSLRVKAIVAVTADAMAGARERCLDAGMDDVLIKPILREDLERTLSRWLKPVGSDVPPAEAPVPGPATAIWVDKARLIKMAEEVGQMKPDFWSDALVLFRADAGSILKALWEAVESENYSETMDRAHALKGICLTLGLVRMAESCKDLQSSATERNKSVCRSRIRSLKEDLEPSLSEAHRMLAGI